MVLGAPGKFSDSESRAPHGLSSEEPCWQPKKSKAGNHFLVFRSIFGLLWLWVKWLPSTSKTPVWLKERPKPVENPTRTTKRVLFGCFSEAKNLQTTPDQKGVLVGVGIFLTHSHFWMTNLTAAGRSRTSATPTPSREGRGIRRWRSWCRSAEGSCE